MGKAREAQPKRLAEKLRQIRMYLELTQQGMADAIAERGVKVYRGYIGNYETDYSIPSLLVLRAYAKIARISTDQIIDDELELPVKMQSQGKSKGSD